jgi:hypothetical protein
MAYGTTAGVSALLPAIGALDATSVPTSAQVTTWLGEGSSQINRSLAGAGYTIPVASTATVYPEIAGLANLYAAAQAAIARGLDTVQGTDENRAETWLERFRVQLSALSASDLTTVGIPLAVQPSGTAKRRRFRTTQVKRVDGYSAPYDDPWVDN